MFRVGITPYYASLMHPTDLECPIRRQSIPTLGELLMSPEDRRDPLAEDADSPVPGITHRYPDRVLFYVTHNCPVYCRFCTRKRKVSDPSMAARFQQLEDGLAYIRANPSIRDVVLSGGDPLSLSDEKLEWIISELRRCAHVEVIRIGSRNLVTLPFRITDAFVDVLRRYQPIYFNTHFNHPRECTLEAFDAAAQLADAGVVIGNQTVLLRGVNDRWEIVKELVHKLLLMRIRPYYLYQCDLAEGLSHFRTPIETGIGIIEKLRGYTSGLAIPQFVVDLPGGGGKVPIGPEYVISHVGRVWRFRNYRNAEFVYVEADGL